MSPTDGFSICGPAAPDLRNGMDSDRLDRLDSDLDRLDSDLRLTSFETIAIAQAIAIPIATARYGRGIYTNSRAAGAAPGVLLRGTGRRPAPVPITVTRGYKPCVCDFSSSTDGHRAASGGKTGGE